VRFYWKKESAVGGTKAGKAKILRSVMYPRVLDMYNFCSDSLKQTLNEGRAIQERQRSEEDAARLAGKKKQAEENDK
jgi:ubiquitin carboxyl-terminal hydrolase 14